MAAGFPRAGDLGGRDGDGGEREREREPHRSYKSFNNLDLEVTHPRVYHILFARRKALSRAHTHGEGNWALPFK